MVELAKPKNSDSGGKEMYWIVDCEDLCWSPGVEVANREKCYVVKCILTGDHYEIEKKEAINIHPSCLGKWNTSQLISC